MTEIEKARERARRFFSANRSVIKRLVESENDLGFHHAKLQEELESDFTAALLDFAKERVNEKLEEAAKVARHGGFVDGPLGTIEGQTARAIQRLKEE